MYTYMCLQVVKPCCTLRKLRLHTRTICTDTINPTLEIQVKKKMHVSKYPFMKNIYTHIYKHMQKTHTQDQGVIFSLNTLHTYLFTNTASGALNNKQSPHLLV